MFFRFLLLNCLFGFIINVTIRDYSYQFNGISDIFSLSNKNLANIYSNNQQMDIKWHDIIFISILILLFIILLICLYYQRTLVNFICSLCSKIKKNNEDINEHVIILHRIPSLKNVNSMYLTVPQPSYLHH